MYHLGDNKSGLELFDNIPKGISAVCKCGAAPMMKIYLHSGKEPQETERKFEKLRENWTKIEDDLEPTYVLSYLFEKKILDIDDTDVIRKACASSRKEGCYELLERVWRCSPERDPMRHFCSVLREKYPHLAELLESSPKTADATAVKTPDDIGDK
ncbi:uncharacterized protein LOC106154911 [Lingula anatina]|uniref:Uncharacterized protein LOC106154911 n=1 Tax=Lingula anatina TaxID=7574 RepID=A0A2R2MRS2_LINAN|nr:uncharacterized protein LOC106154911 [Lingula anatina]|eukprot:XP_023932954.1 uncharacterized protein LOC106154911 [Lingula anatina]